MKMRSRLLATTVRASLAHSRYQSHMVCSACCRRASSAGSTVGSVVVAIS